MIFTRRPSPPFTVAAALFAGSDALLVLIYAIVFDYPTIISCFAGLSTAGVRIFFFFQRKAVSLRHQRLHCLAQRLGAAHISRENHVGDAGELAARVGLPHGDAGADLAQHVGLFHAQRVGADGAIFIILYYFLLFGIDFV